MVQTLPQPAPLRPGVMRIIPLGGIGEIGRNMTVFEIDGKILIVDVGVLFPEEHQPGIDVILPDFGYLKDRLDDVVGIVLTHGHEDHIGGVPYLLRMKQDIPLIGSALTLAFVEAKLKEHRITPYSMVVAEGRKETLAGFNLEFIAVNHSIPDALAVANDDNRPLLILDQVTDPHNVGAIFRTAAAFNAVAVVTQDRHAPPESGALAKAASGGLEITPWVRVVNLARALEEIAESGYWRIGLSGHASVTLDEALTPGRNALVLGAEGDGMRRNIEEHCDQLAKLPISEQMESLNVSNAAAIALYAATVRRG